MIARLRSPMMAAYEHDGATEEEDETPLEELASELGERNRNHKRIIAAQIIELMPNV